MSRIIAKTACFLEVILPYRFMRKKIFILAMILLGGLLILISWKNMQEVTLSFIIWEPTVPLILLIYLTFFGGLLLGVFYTKISSAFTKFRAKRKEKQKGTGESALRSGFMKLKEKRKEKNSE